MKKITGLLVSIICIHVLNGMEPEEYTSSETSSCELASLSKYIIPLKKLYHYNLDMVIEAIKADDHLAHILNERFGHQKEFISLIHLLTPRTETTEVVAKKLATPTAETYLSLGPALLETAKTGDLEKAKFLIAHNADSNFSAGRFVDDGRTYAQCPHFIHYKKTSPLTYAVIYGRAEIVELLLTIGRFPKANYYYKFNGYYPPKFNTPFGVTGTQKDRKEIEMLINLARSQEESY